MDYRKDSTGKNAIDNPTSLSLSLGLVYNAKEMKSHPYFLACSSFDLSLSHLNAVYLNTIEINRSTNISVISSF